MNRIGIAEIAKLSGVSLATAERALNGRHGVKTKTRDRVLQIAREMNYRPNLAAKVLASRNKEILIGVCVPQQLQIFFDQVRAGLSDEAHRFADYGLRIVYSTPGHIGVDLAPHVHALIDQGVRALIVAPTGHESTTSVIEEAEQRGVRVICCPTDVPLSGRSSAVFVDPHLSGALAGELLAKLLPPGARTAILTGSITIAHHHAKVSAFSESFGHYCKNGKVAEVIQGHDDPILTYRMVEGLLDREPQLAGIYVTTANCMPVCHSLSSRELVGKTVLITTDLFPQMRAFLENGTISASFYQQPFRLGQQAMHVLIDMLVFDKAIEPSYRLSPEIVLASNMHMFQDVSSESLLDSPVFCPEGLSA